MKVRNSKGELKELVIKANDSIPANGIIDFDGDIVPEGFEKVEDETETKITELGNNIQDLQNKYNSFIKPIELGFGSSNQLTKKFTLTKRGCAFISIMPNGYQTGEAYILYFNSKDTLTKVYQLLGDTRTLTFNISDGILTITSSVQWSTGFVIFNS
jgi:hypothetical protein